MEISLKRKLFYVFPVLFCFCFPLGFKVLSPILMAWLLVSFFNWDLVQIRQGLFNRNLLLLLLFFLFTLISAFLSENHNEANAAIEIKLSFLLFPYLMFCFHWPAQILKRCLVSFVSGCFFASLYLIARASFFAYQGHPEYFTYTYFSDFIHASYFAMYLVLAIGIIINYYKHWFHTNRQIMISSYVFTSVFVTSIFLCASKMGLITLCLCLPLLLYLKYRSALSVKRSLIFLGIGALVLLLSLRFIPAVYERFRNINTISVENLDKTSVESNTSRLLVWEQSLHIMKENFWFGVGAGDANDALYTAYEQNGISGALEHKLNAHNQYFQTFIGMGVFGFSMLLLLTLFQFLKGIRRDKRMLAYFSLLIILNFLVESMLQAVAGAVFFSFFFCLFNLIDEKPFQSA
ncbi:MAG TPA: O-antigen ligase family protein [Bacteroidia bacterium]|nr:O-antigen ligase family protein [Bacteroidia bacterium]